MGFSTIGLGAEYETVRDLPPARPLTGLRVEAAADPGVVCSNLFSDFMDWYLADKDEGSMDWEWWRLCLYEDDGEPGGEGAAAAAAERLHADVDWVAVEEWHVAGGYEEGG